VFQAKISSFFLLQLKVAENNSNNLFIRKNSKKFSEKVTQNWVLFSDQLLIHPMLKSACCPGLRGVASN